MILTKNHKERIVKLIIFFFAILSFSVLLIYAFSKNMIYFYTPTQAINSEAPINSNIRLGGMVKKNSVSKSKNNLIVSFTVIDLEEEVNVQYDGVLPDLFAEEQGVVMSGKLKSKNSFIANEVLAKHDENYMPPEVADMMKNKNRDFFKK